MSPWPTVVVGVLYAAPLQNGGSWAYHHMTEVPCSLILGKAKHHALEVINPRQLNLYAAGSSEYADEPQDEDDQNNAT